MCGSIRFRDLMEDGQVRISPWQVMKISRKAPEKGSVFERLWDSIHNFTMERKQADHQAFVVPDNLTERGSNFDDDIQFFLQFTDERAFRRFAAFDFTAWKFPATAERLTVGAQAGQVATFRILEHSANHVDHREKA